jgi:hypothetical protein
MATRKRTSRRSSLVGRAVKAGRQALREAEKRVPPNLRRQVERRLKDADKTARAAIKQLQAQAKKASTRGDVNTVLKRIDGLTKQARQIVRGAGTRATTTRRRAATTTRRAASRATKAAGTARRKASAKAASRGRASTTRRRAAPRKPRPAPVMPETMAPEAGGAVEMGGTTET